MKKQVSKSVRKAAVRFALLLVQLVKVDGSLDEWEARYRKTWGRRKVDELLAEAQNVLDVFAKRLAVGKKRVAGIEELRWSGPVDRPWNYSKKESVAALKALNKSLQELRDEAFRRFGAGRLSHFVFMYAERVRELAERIRNEYLAQQEQIVAEKNALETAAPVEADAPQAFDFTINADGSFSMEKTHDADSPSGFIVERRAVPVEEVAPIEEVAPAVSLQAVLDAARRVDGPASVPAYGAPSDAFAKSVKTIIISSTLVRFSNVIIRLQTSRTSDEITAAVLDACREVQSVDDWKDYPETSIIDDAAEEFAAELQALCDDAERFPRLQIIAEKIAAAFGSFAVKALAAA